MVTEFSQRDSARFDDVIARFEAAWRDDEPPGLSEFVADVCDPQRDAPTELISELVLVDLEWRWRVSGRESALAEHYIERFPQLAAAGRTPLWLVTEEYRVRHNWGDRPSHEEYQQRFPELHDELTETLARIDRELGQELRQREPDVPERLGRYQILQRVGSGGFGLVFRARDEELSRDVAIKIPWQDRVSTQEQAAQFLTEARTIAGLDHPSIVPVYDFGRTDDGICYVVTKFIDGAELTAKIGAETWSFDDIASTTADVASALHHAHLRGITHRDVKPANILLDSNGKAYVTDFGLAVRDADVTVDLRLAGTPAYMSPEQARGEGHRVDGRTDIFSLGIVLYELLTGRKPFRGDSTREVLELIKGSEPRPPRQLDDTIPRELERICLKALSKRVGERYSTADDLEDDLRRWESSTTRVSATGAERTTADTRSVSSPSVAAAAQDSTRRDVDPVVIPKGLRSFDADDADFFLNLLPGPRGRDELPDSLRFWKQRIDANDPAKAFTVGMLYGPSGCGKSSLVKAGLIPRLATNVTTVYVEATPNDTESRLRAAIHDHAVILSPRAGLADLIMSVRRRGAGKADDKLLLVIDQFEQWLHAHPSPAGEPLVDALRQCDGVCVQCLLLVRDDFWLSSCRFMEALEVELSPGRNVAVADLFDVPHAERVLTRFGQAYDRLPKNDAEMRDEQQNFVRQAVASLARDGRVVCVHLSLFADLVKGRPWDPATLSEYGGMHGLGVMFLEESFTSRAALPGHRLHQAGARDVLRSLLPDQGTDIKGAMRSRDELAALSEYDSPGRDFEGLVQILDNDLRLITPTDPPNDGSPTRVAPSDEPVGPGQVFYQLTHDYLVPSLRQWLTRRQQETMRGRAELRLAERAGLWNDRPERRYLPSFPEWLRISLLTTSRHRTSSQQRMMAAATRSHLLRTAAVAAVLAIVGTIGFEILGRWQARAAYQQLLVAETTEIPGMVDGLTPLRRWIDPMLQRSPGDGPGVAEDRAALNTALARLPVDASQADWLVERLLSAAPAELLVIRDALFAHRAELTGRLWDLLEDDSGQTNPTIRFRAGVALAVWDPPDRSGSEERWGRVARFLANQMLDEMREYPGDFDALLASVAPLHELLVAPLRAAYRDESSDRRRSLSTSILSEFATDNLELLVELIEDADARQFVALMPKLRDTADRVIPLMEQKLAEPMLPEWDDPPLDPSWTAPESGIVRKIEAADGLIETRFALCQTLPLQDFVDVAEGLRPSGYRPIRFRPVQTSRGTVVAAVWRRDGVPWRLESDISKAELQAADDRYQQDGFIPEDVAGFRSDQDERFVGLWRQPADQTVERRVTVGVNNEEHRIEYDQLAADGFDGVTYHLFWGQDGQPRKSIVQQKLPALAEWTYAFVEPDYAHVFAWRLQIDVVALKTPHGDIRSPARPISVMRANRMETLNRSIERNANSFSARRERANLRLQSSDWHGALEDLDVCVERTPDDVWSHFALRAVVRARLGQVEPANGDLQIYMEQVVTAPRVRLFWEMLLQACLDDEQTAAAQMEALLKQFPRNRPLLVTSTSAYSVASLLCRDLDSARSEHYRTRALELFERTLATSRWHYYDVIDDIDLDPIRDDARFRQIVEQCAGRFYIGTWTRRDRLRFESHELHGMTTSAHVAECRRLIADRCRPVAISTVETPGTPPGLFGASVWHRPVTAPSDVSRTAARRANLTIALLQLGRPDALHSRLSDRTSQERSYLIDRLHAFATEPDALIQSAGAVDNTRRFGAIVALAEYSPDELAGAGESFVEDLLRMYRNDPSAAIHGAAEYTLRRWGFGDQLRAMEADLATAAAPADARDWFVNTEQHTMVVHEKPGVFAVGSGLFEAHTSTDYELHYRRIERSFAIASREVTVAQWRRFAAENRQMRVNEFADYAPDEQCPQTGVTWFQAAAYCNWLSMREGLDPCYEPNDDGHFDEGMKNAEASLDRTGYRLPTQAEWEFSCRAGSSTRYCFGDDPALLTRYAWFVENSEERLWPVGRLRPNEYGLFDMHGNAFEWCIRGGGALSNQGGVSLDEQVYYDVLYESPQRRRGGAFNSLAGQLRSGHVAGFVVSYGVVPKMKTPAQGFRIVRTLPE